MSHSCFIHSSTEDGHLGCFRILEIVNNTAVSMGVLRFFQISVLASFRYIPRTGMAGSKGRSIFNFSEVSPYCFPQWLHQSAFPPTVEKGAPFATPLPALVCWFIDDGTSDQWYLIVVLICISWWLVTLSIFSYAYWPSVCPLWRCLFRFLAHFLIGLFVYFWCWVL